MNTISYKDAGVDIEAGNEAVRRIKAKVERTFSKEVLASIGSFASLYDLKPLIEQYHHPLMVQSIDGVGTKMIVARMMNKFDTIGMDLVSATANDIIVLGAKPLTLLDYIATDKLKPDNIEAIVSGMARACIENDISLVGGETAEMPDTYLTSEHDLVGVITGVVEKNNAITGKNIKPGDKLFAFLSSGLHTNGYSLARKLFFDKAGYKVESYIPEFSRSLGETLLEPHINYTRPVLELVRKEVAIKGMAHITGGGLLENIPRVLPKSCSARIYKSKCPTPALFAMLAELGQLGDAELYKTFNMGIGLVMILAEQEVDAMHTALLSYPQFKAFEIGEIIPGAKEVSIV